tara:strand:- start:1176 stop:1421 length:246 start_codon:yes stop_codon:yes gene_type:complete
MKAKTINYLGLNTLVLDVKGSHLKVGDIVKVKDDCKCEWTMDKVPSTATIREIYDNGNINLDVGTNLFPNVEPNDFIKLNK